MARYQLVGDSAFAPTLATTAVIPVLNGAVTGTGDATTGLVTLADLATFFNVTSAGPITGSTITFTVKVIGATALTTPSALAATTGQFFASTVSGATLMGFGTTGDVTLKNRAGTDVIVVTSNTTGVTMAGALAMTGALSGVTTLATNGVATLSDATDSTSATTGSVKLAGGLGVAKALFVGLGIRSVSPTAGIGYATGAGGAQTQATSKATTVVSNTVTTLITMAADQLGLLTIVSFTFTNSAIAATDHILINHESGGTVGAYTFQATPGAGTSTIFVRNATAGNLSEAIVIRITIIKAVSA